MLHPPSSKVVRAQPGGRSGLPAGPVNPTNLQLRDSAGLSPASPFSPAIRGIGHRGLHKCAILLAVSQYSTEKRKAQIRPGLGRLGRATEKVDDVEQCASSGECAGVKRPA